MPGYLRQVARVSMRASLLVWSLEFAYTIATGAWPFRSPVPTAMLLLLSFLLFSGWGVAATLVQWTCIRILARIHRAVARRGEARAHTVTAFAASAALAPLIAYFSLRLFSGKGISQFAYVSALKAGLFVCALSAAFALARAVSARAGVWFDPSSRGMRVIVGWGGTALLLILYIVNARWYVGQYEFVHRAMGLVIFLIAELVLITLLGPAGLAAPPPRRFVRLLRLIVFIAPCELALLCYTVGGSPGSRQLSAIYSRFFLGKYVVPLYGFSKETEEISPCAYEEYLATRDAFVNSAPKIMRKGCNVIFIVVDSLRARNLSLYGYSRNTSPRIVEFAGRSTLFLRAYSQASNTSESTPSILTGCYKSTIDQRGGYSGVEALPEMLAREGYDNSAVMPDAPEFWRYVKMLRQEAWKSAADAILASRPDRVLTAPETTRLATEIIRDSKKGSPFFLFLNYYDPHSPYDKHEGFDYGPSDEDIYDSEVSYADRSIGELLDQVWRVGLQDNTIILLMADHGEQFAEYGGFGHPGSLYDIIIHVPLIVYVPGITPRVVDTPVQLIDVCPTLVSLLGFPTGARFDGASLVPLMEGISPPYTPLVFSEADREAVCLVSYPWKLIYNMRDSFFALYDLATDPWERVNRIEGDVVVAYSLKKMLLSWLSYQARALPSPPDAESPAVTAVLRRLRARDTGAFDELHSLPAATMSREDFVLLSRELGRGILSPDVANFYLSVARTSPRLRPRAMNALVSVTRQASSVLESADDPRHDEANAILSTLLTPGVDRFLLSLVRDGKAPLEQSSLTVIGLAGVTSCREELYDLYVRGKRSTWMTRTFFPPARLWRWFFPRKTPYLEKLLFPVLCRLADPRVERELLKEGEGSGPEDQLNMLPLFVNYRSDDCREFLLRLLDHDVWDRYVTPLSYSICREIGRSKNPFMLPVLMKIITFRQEQWNTTSLIGAAYTKKEAILHFINIKGEKNLTVEDRRKIREECDRNARLSAFPVIRTLRKTL